MRICFGEEDFRHLDGNYFKKMAEFGIDSANFDLCKDSQPFFYMSDQDLQKTMAEYKTMADEAGIKIYQAHGPWRWPVKDNTPEDRAERMEKMKTSIRACALLECKYWVIHPIMPYGVNDKGTENEQKTWNVNKEFMTELLAYAKEQGVIICYENMPMTGLAIGYPLDVLRFVEEMNDDNFKICMDIGHAEICKSQISVGDAIRKMGDKIACFHIHDNNGWADIHTMPMTGCVDWDDVCAAIKEIGYEGDLCFETMAAKTLPADIFTEQTNIFVKIAKLIEEKIK